MKHITLLINAELMGNILCPLLFCNIKIKTKTGKNVLQNVGKRKESVAKVDKQVILDHRVFETLSSTLNQ